MNKKLFFITSSTEEAFWLKQELSALHLELNSVDIFPAPDAMPGVTAGTPEVIGQRLAVLNNFIDKNEYAAVAPLRAVLCKTALDFAERIVLKKGEEIILDELIEKLLAFSYIRRPVTGERGEFSVKGGIIDVFPANANEPARIEFFGDAVESIRIFDPVSQRAKTETTQIMILLSRESREKGLFEILPRGITVVIDKGTAAFEELKDTLAAFAVDNLSAWVAPRLHPLRRAARIPGRKNEGVGEDIRADLEVNDYVVHEDYGVGIYRGLHRIEEGEFILIEFGQGDKLYVPPNLMGRVEKYVSEEGYKPKLSRLGGVAWQNLKSRVKKSVKDLTRDLLDLYAERKRARKDPLPPDDAWQKELEDSFPYEETADQLKAINEVRRDLESEIPMDRLLCGDVGYGKTEVALRAIVKTASAGHQVAVLVPTTILAEQHYHYFKERLSTFPFTIAALSRFKSKDEQKNIVEGLKLAEINIVVGTHRLLQKDVVFRDLGLIVIDEEHRFGVTHKEKFKKLRKNVDVLSMTATPIPRTLYLSLSGARDLSLIQTPPADRSPVRTYVAAFNPTLVREAILRELDRGGQVFFVHNRVETIDNVAVTLKELIPELRIAVAHGQLRALELEKVMDEFLNREHDVLLCTAIIESGLDIPNVNTIIINYASRLGLAQLYQLRGRVGRSPVRAYAYLLYHPEEMATASALARLSAIQEFTTLGAGYKLALRDLEIRGCGNLLGAQQHGHMLAVGFDLYSELLEEAVKEIKGEKPLPSHRAPVAVPKGAYIPADYIEDEQQRIAIYRRLNLIGSKEEIDDLKKELRDRFGRLPPPCQFLLDKVKEIISRSGL